MTALESMPGPIEVLVDALATMPGVVAVVLGGSRAEGAADAASDWDLGVYYRGALDTTALAERGTVHPPGSWGRIMNGGAWLTVGGAKVDVLLRDLDVAEYWAARAVEGVFEVDCLLAYVAGIPTYSLMAERAVARLLRGSLPAVGAFPDRLAATAPVRWHYSSRFSLEQARMRAARGDRVGTMGQAAKAVIEHAHAVLCERRVWVLNEKRIVETAGLHETQALFGTAPTDLMSWVDTVARTLG
jgi:hypothetical protein